MTLNDNRSMLTLRVARKIHEAERIFSFELVEPAGGLLPPFSAGSHIDCYLADGLVRQYSLCNNPVERYRYLIGVLRDPASRGGSTALHDGIHEGDLIQISLPRNHFPLVPAEKTLLFAGGIGVTPILSMAEWLADTAQDFELHYVVRSFGHAAFATRLMRSRFADRVSLHRTDGPDNQKLDAAAVLRNQGMDARLFLCGPAGFMDWITQTALDTGWDPARLHREYFAGVVTAPSALSSFQVELARSGQVFDIPEYRSIAEVLIAAGIDVPISCEQGLCGACLTRVLAGTVDHRDLFQTDVERKGGHQMMPCVSRALSPRLILDL